MATVLRHGYRGCLTLSAEPLLAPIRPSMGVEIVGFLGLGAMGSGMLTVEKLAVPCCAHFCSAVTEVCAGLASNLQRFLKDQGTHSKYYGKLHVWNRSPAKAAPLQELGASLNPSAAGALPAPAACLDAGLASCCLAFCTTRVMCMAQRQLAHLLYVLCLRHVLIVALLVQSWPKFWPAP